MNKRIAFLFFIVAGLFLFSCCGKVAESSVSYGAQPQERSMKSDGFVSGFAMEEAEPMVSESSISSFDDISMDERSNLAQTPADKPQDRPDPMRIYNGSAHLVVEDPRETRQHVEQRVKEWGGYLESSFGDTLVLRIPAELFYESFDEILSLGKIINERIDTWDVTEAFMDLQGRLSLAEETRERLYQLLERTSDPQERSKILREIGRLTEEVEQIRLNMQSLENRASMSRITLVLEPRISREENTRSSIPFPWIAQLNPLYPQGGRFRASIDVDLGPSFAVFTDSEYFLAENPGGTILRISTLDNDPRGDDAFWQNALLFHLKDYYLTAEPYDLHIGDDTLPAVDFLSKDREPYRYLVAVKSDGKKLHLLEIFQPDGEEVYGDLLLSLQQGEWK